MKFLRVLLVKMVCLSLTTLLGMDKVSLDNKKIHVAVMGMKKLYDAMDLTKNLKQDTYSNSWMLALRLTLERWEHEQNSDNWLEFAIKEFLIEFRTELSRLPSECDADLYALSAVLDRCRFKWVSDPTITTFYTMPRLELARLVNRHSFTPHPVHSKGVLRPKSSVPVKSSTAQRDDSECVRGFKIELMRITQALDQLHHISSAEKEMNTYLAQEAHDALTALQKSIAERAYLFSELHPNTTMNRSMPNDNAESDLANMQTDEGELLEKVRACKKMIIAELELFSKVKRNMNILSKRVDFHRAQKPRSEVADMSEARASLCV